MKLPAGTRRWQAAGAALAAIATLQTAVAADPISIAAPTAGETVHDNRGRLSVSVEVRAGASTAAGYKVQAMLDGQPAGAPRAATRFTLSGIDRGAHSLQVWLVAPDGTVAARSAPVTFNMWQASRLFPSRR